MKSVSIQLAIVMVNFQKRTHKFSEVISSQNCGDVFWVHTRL
jgi:hypothetical protein